MNAKLDEFEEHLRLLDELESGMCGETPYASVTSDVLSVIEPLEAKIRELDLPLKK